MSARWFLGVLFFALIVSASAVQTGAKTKPTTPPEQVELKARVTGYIAKVHFKPGADVKEGEVLFEIDPRVYQAQLDQASAQCQLAEAQLKLASAQLTRAQALLKTNAISREEFDKITADRAIAEANLKLSQASGEIARLNLSFTKVTAPFAGKVERALVTEGNLVKADDTILATLQRTPSPKKQPETPPSAKLKELLKERVVVLTKATAIIVAQYQQGIVDFDKVVQAQRSVIDAQLEVAESQAQRIDLLRENVKLAEALHKITEAQFNVGKATAADMLRARAFVLEAQIRSLREEEKAKAAK